MVAITKWLQFFIPEGHSMLTARISFVREIEHVNTMWWRTRTSPIVALFMTEEEARACFEWSDLEPCDRRFINQTKEVLAMVDEDHPTITVCHDRDLALIQD